MKNWNAPTLEEVKFSATEQGQNVNTSHDQWTQDSQGQWYYDESRSFS